MKKETVFKTINDNDDNDDALIRRTVQWKCQLMRNEILCFFLFVTKFCVSFRLIFFFLWSCLCEASTAHTHCGTFEMTENVNWLEFEFIDRLGNRFYVHLTNGSQKRIQFIFNNFRFRSICRSFVACVSVRAIVSRPNVVQQPSLTQLRSLFSPFDCLTMSHSR